MPRPLVFGNGSFLVNLDCNGDIRDVFWPRVGMPNHLQGHKIKLGFWVEDRFAWLEDEGWHREQRYDSDALVGSSCYFNHELGLRVRIREAVHPSEPAFLRELMIEGLRAHAMEVRVFVNSDFRLNESDIGDTAFYHPDSGSMIHYKAEVAMLIGGGTSHEGLFEFTTGLKAFNGVVGTWPDAQDGTLHPNPISQGSVDSTFSVRGTVEPLRHEHFSIWLVAGSGIEDVTNRFGSLGGARAIPFQIDHAERYWHFWQAADPHDLSPLPLEIRELYRRSLQIIKTQCDRGGAILAANDSDIMETNRATYSFLWPRDGALVALVTDAAGHREIGRAFFRLCAKLLPKDRPMLLHKYAPDGTLGASWHPWLFRGVPEVPFQQDETALTIYALGHHLRSFPDADLLVELFEPLVAPACDYMELHRSSTGLPLASYDLWEERRGIHCFTVATTIAAFHEASWMAAMLGDPREMEYARVAEEMQIAAYEHLFDAKHGCFYRRLDDDGKPDLIVDSAVLSMGLYGAVPLDHPHWIATVEKVKRHLTIVNGIGGVARYEGDYYFRRSEIHPGNPWIICTHWLVQAQMMMASNLAELDALTTVFDWTLHRATESGVLSEQYHPVTGEPLSVSPLTWSHAEFCRTVQLYLARRLALSSAAE